MKNLLKLPYAPLFLAFSLLAAGVDSKAAPLASTLSLLEELGQAPDLVRAMPASEMLDALSKGQLVSMGESHESGLERQAIADTYSGLADRGLAPEQCLMETSPQNDSSTGVTTYPSLVDADGPSDPVYAPFYRVCAKERMYDSLSSDYSGKLAAYLKSPADSVLTHTGFRHMLPWAALYPEDFAPNAYVDGSAHGNLTLQLPPSFVKNGSQMRSHEVLALDNLAVQMLEASLKQLPAAATAQAGALVDIDHRMVTALQAAQARLAAKSGTFELARVQASFPYHRAFVTIIDHRILRAEMIHALLSSPATGTFFSSVNTAKVHVGYYRNDDPNSIVGIGDAQFSGPGWLYLSATSQGSTDTLYLVVDPSTLQASVVH